MRVHLVNFYYVILYHIIILFFCTPRKLFFSFNKVGSTLDLPHLFPFLLFRLTDSLFEWQPCCATFLPKTARSGRVRVTGGGVWTWRWRHTLPRIYHIVYTRYYYRVQQMALLYCAPVVGRALELYFHTPWRAAISLFLRNQRKPPRRVCLRRGPSCVRKRGKKRKTHDKNYISK